MTRAIGTFEISTTAHPPYDVSDGITVGRMTFQKTFRGGLVATSVVEMLYARTPIADSAGYVAIERVKGALAEKSGSFVLQHSGTMEQGKTSLALTVVPGSATGDLKGLAGSMQIDVIEKQHQYTFEYELDRL